MNLKKTLPFIVILVGLFFYFPNLQAKIIWLNQPQSGTYCEGTPLEISVSVIATNPTYQWVKVGVDPIPGATQRVLSTASVSLSDEGSYVCVVTDPGGSEYSDPADINVISAPHLLGGGTSGFKDYCEGTTNAYVDAFGSSSTGTVTFQWRNGQSIISGATSNNYELPALTIEHSGNYNCIIGHTTNGCTVTSEITTITVVTKSTNPSAINITTSAPHCEDSKVTMEVQGGSLGNYAAWKWYKGSGLVTDPYWGTGSSISPTVTATSGYWVRAEDGICPNTNIATVLVNVAAKPTISWAGVGGDLCLGNTANLHVEGDLGGAPDARWIWSRNGDEIFRTESNNYQYTPPSAGVNTYEVYADGGCGSTTKRSDSHTVKTLPSITQDLVIAKKCEGDSHSLQVAANGSAPLSYRFSKDGEPFTSWISSNSQTLSNLTEDDEAVYKVEVENECGDDESTAQLTVNPLPAIDLGDDVSICEGETATIGTDLSFSDYSWNTGAETAKIEVSEENTYTLTVTDAESCSNSDDISVNTDNPITPVNLGEDRSYCMGDDALVNAGTGYDKYIWSTGQIGATSISVTETGDYSVSVSNVGNVCSSEDEVHITVYKPFEDEEICMVLIDPDTRKNMIVWEKTPDVRTEKYQVWKVTAMPYVLIDEVTYSDTSVVIDINSKPSSSADAYVLVVIDSCGNASEQSMWHKPFHLQSGLGLNDVVNLNWQAYLTGDNESSSEFNFESIVIFRGTDSLSLTPIDTMYSGFDQYSYTDENPPKGVNVYYRIGGEKSDACDPNGILKQKATAGPYVHSLSNLEDNRLQATGILNSSSNIKLYPNPMTDATYLELSGVNSKPVELKICDLSGRVLRTSTHYEDKILIERNDLKSGCYLIRLSSDKEYSGMLMVR